MVNQAVLGAVANKTDLEIDFGGGVQSEEDIRIVFESGAKQVTAGSVCVKDPYLVESWLEHMRQHHRVTKADVKIEKKVLQYHLDKDRPRARHLIASVTSSGY